MDLTAFAAGVVRGNHPNLSPQMTSAMFAMIRRSQRAHCMDNRYLRRMIMWLVGTLIIERSGRFEAGNCCTERGARGCLVTLTEKRRPPALCHSSWCTSMTLVEVAWR